MNDCTQDVYGSAIGQPTPCDTDPEVLGEVVVRPEPTESHTEAPQPVVDNTLVQTGAGTAWTLTIALMAVAVGVFIVRKFKQN